MTRGELYKELLKRQKHLESQDFSLEGFITVIKNYDKVTQTYTLAQLLLYNV